MALISAIHPKNFNLPYFWVFEGSFSNACCLIRQKFLDTAGKRQALDFHREEWAILQA